MAYNGQLNAYNAAQQKNASIWNAVGQGAGAASALWMMSSKRLKETLGDAETFLGRVRTLPIRTWRYDAFTAAERGLDRDVHIGPYAEDFAKTFGGPPDKIHLGDAIFILWRAFQQLASEVADACDNAAAPASA